MRILCSFLFCLMFSGTSIAEKPPTEAIRKSKKGVFQEEDIAISPSMYSDQLDVPIINPTTPGMNNPNPNPTMTSPPPPSTTGTNPNPSNNPGPSTGGSWCVASPTASPTALQVALDYACGFGGADCSAIQPGASCYEPATVKDHASYAFNDYYQKNPIPTSCVFGGTAQFTYADPSSGNCHYASPKSTPNTPPVLPPPPPSTMMPVNPYTPGGQNGYGSEPTDYGEEPTGSPSGADNLSSNIRLLFTMASFMVVITANYV